jgi:hypothetical protein
MGLDEMTTIVVQQEKMMRKSKIESAHMVTRNHSEGERKFYKGTRNNQNGNKGGNFNNSKPQFKHKNEDMKGKCFWCRKKGHVKKDCNRFKNWLEKKGIQKQEEAKRWRGCSLHRQWREGFSRIHRSD